MLKACSRCGKIHGYNECEIPKPTLGYRKKGTTDVTRFRSSAEWKKKRNEILRRDCGCCRLCLRNGIITTYGLEVHHIVPIVKNDKLKTDNNNLITVCRSCHDLIENDKSYFNVLISLTQSPPFNDLTPGTTPVDRTAHTKTQNIPK